MDAGPQLWHLAHTDRFHRNKQGTRDREADGQQLRLQEQGRSKQSKCQQVISLPGESGLTAKTQLRRWQTVRSCGPHNGTQVCCCADKG